MIPRYQRPEMVKVWSDQNKFETLLKVEIAVAKAQAEIGIVPALAAEAIEKRGRIDVERILEIEKTTRHDVIAFVSQVAETVGEYGRYIHFGLTSSDVLDTGMSLIVQEAWRVLEPGLQRLERALLKLVSQHRETICAGRTHGMHAEPTTFSLIMASFLEEFSRNQERLASSVEQLRIVKLSGAVGTFSGLQPEIEKRVGELLSLKPEAVATQVVPRDRHAQVFLALAMFGASLERIAIELRHLQRTEVGEAEEGFSKGQKGSSAMPHKRNPISSENLTGLARLLRSYAVPALENVALWHERDISHSSVERVIFPDAFILADYSVQRLAEVLENLIVYPEKMKINLELSYGQTMSSHFLLALVEKGLAREEAYKIVQTLSHGLAPKQSLKDAALQNVAVTKLLSEEEVRAIFSGDRHLQSCKNLANQVLNRYQLKSTALSERNSV